MVTPRERRHEITKQRILDAAREILVAQGLAGLSIRELARKIDYTPSAIYKYFDSKEAILQAIREEGFHIANAMQAEAMAQVGTLPEKILAAGRTYLRFAEAYPEHYQLMFNSRDISPESLQTVFNDPTFNDQSLPNMVEDGIQQGLFRLPPGYTPELFALQALVMVHGMAMFKLGLLHSVREEFGLLSDQMLQNYLNFFLVPPQETGRSQTP